MRTLTFIFALLLIGCSSSTGPETEKDVFEPYTVGTWEITSPTNADWIGESGSAKSAQADTIDIKSPGQRDLKLIKPEGSPDSYFEIQFIDSTINLDYKKQHNITRAVLITPKSNLPADQNINHPHVLTIGRMSEEWNSDRFKAKFAGGRTCGYENDFESSNPVILIRYEREDETLIRAYRIFVNGILDAVHEITTC